MGENRIDGQRFDAPELAAYGGHKVGVRTVEMVHRAQVDILRIDAAAKPPVELPEYDRNLTAEIWYPAAEDATGETVFQTDLRDGKTTAEIHGKAMRDATPAKGGKFPLLVISHGYPGNRYLMAHLAENIASKGYVVAAIDHLESTYRTAAHIGSTLVNRPLDQRFVLGEIDRLSRDPAWFLNAGVDAQNAALLGYSMGGYGAVITAGGGVTAQSVGFGWGAPQGTLGQHVSGSDAHNDSINHDFKTVIAVAPWGMQIGLWSPQTLEGVKIPMLFIAGSIDDVSGYNDGVRAIWEAAVNVDRALLTFENANHNAGITMPAPKEADRFDADLGFNISGHYSDPVWDTVRMNNITQHFVTAWLGKHLLGDAGMDIFMDLVPNSNDGIWAKNDDGTAQKQHSHWAGFPERTAKGLRFEKRAAKGGFKGK